MFCHNKWNLFRQTFRQGGTMFDCFSWARKNATRESIMGSKYFWNFIIIRYFFGSIEKNNNIRTVQSESSTFASHSFGFSKNARLQRHLADLNAIWWYFASIKLLVISSIQVHTYNFFKPFWLYNSVILYKQIFVRSSSFCRTWGEHVVYKNCSEC